ncbi:MAG TPA: autotransporter outer membrane beta-barrel domain-containing protein [Hyphomicrobium sp.]|nr:autotransporter outer membrane beta-barrel domain-containing protein [Hyphomicrobium sp.]HRO49441.1 autotransporter outer membrane beta-barrel domain-containing protein [Hyphomicrobium sp.]
MRTGACVFRSKRLTPTMLLAAIALNSGAALASGPTGCEAINQGALDFSVAPGQSGARGAILDQGDALAIAISTDSSASVSVDSVADGPETLYSGPASSVLFVAPRSGDYGFRVSAESGSGARLRITCTSAAHAWTERRLEDRRKAFLAARDPDRMRIDRPRGEFNPFGDTGLTGAPEDGPPRDITASFSLSELTAAMNPDQKREPGILDFWFEGRHLHYDTVDMNARDVDGNMMVMYFGSKYMLGPDIMLGTLAQFDQAVEGTGVSARGWMAGPYVSVRFGHGIIFDGRAAWGTADGLPRGIMLDTASADRRLMRGTLRGTRPVAGWTFSPSVGLSYADDTPELRGTAVSHTPATGGSGRLDFLPEVKRRFTLDSETYLEPRFAAGGFLAFEDFSEITPGNVTAHPDLHWKAEAGVALGKKDSLSLEATGGVETGGQTGTDTWSGRLQLNMPLGK